MRAADEAAIARQVVGECYATACRMERLSHFNNAVFRLHLPDGPRILKIAKSPEGTGVRKEVALIGRLAGAGVPAPAVEHADPGAQRAPRPWFVMRSAGERTVFDWRNAQGPQAERLYGQMGAALAGAHAITFARTGDIRGDAIVDRDLEGFLAGLHAWADTLAREGHLTAAEALALRERPLPPVDGTALCHGDFHAVHCVVDGERVGALVDWESAWSGNPLVDLAIACAYLDYYSRPPLLERFLEGYASVTPIPVEFEHAYLPVRMAHLVGCLRVWHVQGEHAWRRVLDSGRVSRLVALYRRYADRFDA